ncbi:MAG TPA: SulP family inorganic anion transporter, partial [Chitinophagaceae bacterium]|nr:SulP family inorganic anion transporter [Chitinophagaceae bacterium]
MKKAKAYIHSLPSDFTSAIVVFLVALPLCLGIALGSGAPLFSGIIAGIVGGVVIGALSGSHLSVSGPAAGLTAIVVVAIGKIGPFEGFLCSVVICGVLQIVLGFLKAGVLGDYIPSSVIKGMLAAIGLILILKQLPHFVGFEGDYEGDEAFKQKDGRNTFTELLYAVQHMLPTALVIGLISLGIQVLWDKVLTKKAAFFKLLPAPLVVVLAGVGINAYLVANYPALALAPTHLVNIPVAKNFAEFTTFFRLPDASFLSDSRIWITGITLAIVASLETLLNIEAADEVDPFKRVTPTNRELKAQGVGNLVSGMLG